MPTPDKKNPVLAAVLSLVPGLGQWYIGKKQKALALFCVDIGLVLSLIFFRSPLAPLLAGVVYAMTALPAGLEAYLSAKTGHASSLLDSKAYVILMLLTTGFNALPLLWQNAHFSRRAKILWTVAVPLLAVLFFGAIWKWGVPHGGK